MLKVILLCSASVLAISCALPDDGGGGGGGGGGGDGGSGAGPDATQPTPTGIAPLVGSRADAAGSLYPVAVGLAWTYDVDAGTTTCTPGARTIRFRDRTMSGGRTVFAMDTPCDYFAPGSNRVWIEGDAVFSQVATAAVSKVLAGPLAHGATWTVNSSVTGDWIREGAPVTVAAGTFTDCWTAHVVPWEGWSTYCRGVGLVRTRSASGGGNTGFGIELLSYDFSALP